LLSGHTARVGKPLSEPKKGSATLSQSARTNHGGERVHVFETLNRHRLSSTARLETSQERSIRRRASLLVDGRHRFWSLRTQADTGPQFRGSPNEREGRFAIWCIVSKAQPSPERFGMSPCEPILEVLSQRLVDGAIRSVIGGLIVFSGHGLEVPVQKTRMVPGASVLRNRSNSMSHLELEPRHDFLEVLPNHSLVFGVTQ
jgi:hypothetical protein